MTTPKPKKWKIKRELEASSPNTEKVKNSRNDINYYKPEYSVMEIENPRLEFWVKIEIEPCGHKIDIIIWIGRQRKHIDQSGIFELLLYDFDLGQLGDLRSNQPNLYEFYQSWNWLT